VDGGHPTIDTFLIRPDAYPAKILEKGCPIWRDNRGCTVTTSLNLLGPITVRNELSCLGLLVTVKYFTFS